MMQLIMQKQNVGKTHFTWEMVKNPPILCRFVRLQLMKIPWV
jgi:hypothetical protein